MNAPLVTRPDLVDSTPVHTRPNVIILTHGWTGSSVFAGLLGKGAGYWNGEGTVVKSDYDTFENDELVFLNNQLLEQLGFKDNHEFIFDHEQIVAMAERFDELDTAPYEDFLRRCNEHQPWVWKDPRLTWTIRIWARLMDLSSVRFLILTRDRDQAWITANQRRHIQSRAFTNAYNDGITESLKRFTQSVDKAFIEIQYEDLLLQPEATIERMNEFLGLDMTMEHLAMVHKGQLYRKTKGWKDRAEAAAIYFKNYAQRDFRQVPNRGTMQATGTNRASQA